jgi:enterochelin esterase-like enzyme
MPDVYKIFLAHVLLPAVSSKYTTGQVLEEKMVMG